MKVIYIENCCFIQHEDGEKIRKSFCVRTYKVSAGPGPVVCDHVHRRIVRTERLQWKQESLRCCVRVLQHRRRFRIWRKEVVMLAKYMRNKGSGKADLLNICVTPQTPNEVSYLTTVDQHLKQQPFLLQRPSSKLPLIFLYDSLCQEERRGIKIRSYSNHNTSYGFANNDWCTNQLGCRERRPQVFNWINLQH